jgi:1,4-alpha-glucan branching enzyme
MQFGQDNDKLREYNPGTGHTWWDDRLDLDAYQADSGRTKVRNWYREMIQIRKQDRETLATSPIRVRHIHNDNGVAAFTRAGGKYLVVMNFKGNSWQRYNVGVSGRYRELANSSWPVFNLGGYPERTRGGDQAFQVDEVPVPAYGVVVLRRE